MNASIVILGGYGAVGRVTARLLGEWFPGRVVVAGRDLGRAQELVRTTDGVDHALRTDVTDPADVEHAIEGASVVVMCVERANTEVARACLARGVHYVDVSASAPVLESIAALDVRTAATAVLSVGVAPGLTNILARHCAERLPKARKVDVSLLLGQGGDHGVDSVRWLVDHLAEPGRGRSGRVLLAGAGKRTVHPFPFSDQHTIGEALGVRATTRICFDSPLVTSAVFALRDMRFFALARRLHADAPLASLLSRVRFGSDRFVVQVTASDADGNAATSTVTGRDTAHATGVVTALAVRALHTGAAPAGVVHIDQVLHELDELRSHAMTVHHLDVFSKGT